MLKVVKVTDMWGKTLPLDRMEIKFVGKDYILASFKGYGFLTNYSKADGYTVITKEV